MVKLSSLLFQRLELSDHAPTEPELNDLRARNSSRAAPLKRVPPALAARIKRDKKLPLSESQLGHNRALILEQLLPARDHAVQGLSSRVAPSGLSPFGTASSLSLRDLLPGFMALTAHRATIGEFPWRPTMRWIRLAADFMLHAVLEQFLIRGAAGSDVVAEVLAYGFDGPQTEFNDADARLVYDLYATTEAHSESKGVWQQMIADVIQLVRPLPPSPSLPPSERGRVMNAHTQTS